MRPVIDNIASMGTDAEQIDKYSSASLLSIGNRLECCCHTANGLMSELAHFTSMATSVEVSCVDISLAATLISWRS